MCRYDCDSASTTATDETRGTATAHAMVFATPPLLSLSGMRAICMNKVGGTSKAGRKDQGRKEGGNKEGWFLQRETLRLQNRTASIPPPSCRIGSSSSASGSFKPKCTFSLPPITCSAFTTIERAAQILSGRVRPSERGREWRFQSLMGRWRWREEGGEGAPPQYRLA